MASPQDRGGLGAWVVHARAGRYELTLPLLPVQDHLVVPLAELFTKVRRFIPPPTWIPFRHSRRHGKNNIAEKVLKANESGRNSKIYSQQQFLSFVERFSYRTSPHGRELSADCNWIDLSVSIVQQASRLFVA